MSHFGQTLPFVTIHPCQIAPASKGNIITIQKVVSVFGRPNSDHDHDIAAPSTATGPPIANQQNNNGKPEYKSESGNTTTCAAATRAHHGNRHIATRTSKPQGKRLGGRTIDW